MAASNSSKIPPQAQDVEKSILGAMLIDKDAPARVFDTLDENGFFSPQHQRIFRSMWELFQASQPIDVVTVSQELRKHGKSNGEESVYLSELAGNIPSSTNIDTHARILKEKALLRQTITFCADISNRAFMDA